MKIKTLIKTFLIIIFLFASIYMINCVPPSTEVVDEAARLESIEKAHQDSIRKGKCERYLSFAYSYYQNQDWQRTIDNYRKMVDLGCEEDYANDIFRYYGRAYQQLAAENPAYYDSALFIYLKGEEYLPNDMFLHKNISYIYHMQGKSDLEIREYEKMVELNLDNIELYRKLVKLCFSAERYDDVLWAIKEILRLNPNDEQAINDQLTAYAKLGKDITMIQKEQWEKNPDNVRYGLDYAAALSDQLQYDKAIEVYKKVAAIDPKNREAYENLGKLYYALDKNEKAIETYIHINKNILPRDLEVIQNIVKGYQLLFNFKEAYRWAEKAVEIGGSSLAYKIRADLYYSAADYYTGDKQANFEDKLVYKLAYDDYRKALQMGNQSVKKRIDFLKEYLIPSKEDWFMHKYDDTGAERKIFRPRGNNYNWITAEAKKD